MSDPTPPATGGESKKGSWIPKVVVGVIAAYVVIEMNLIGSFASQVGRFFQMLSMNDRIILMLVVVFAIFMMIKSAKK